MGNQTRAHTVRPYKRRGNQKNRYPFLSSLQQNTTPPPPTALDHWFSDAYNIWLKGSGNSAEFKMRTRRTRTFPLNFAFDLDRLRKAGS